MVNGLLTPTIHDLAHLLAICMILFGVWVMVSSNNGNLRKITLPVLLLASAFAISACQSKTANLDSLDGLTTASTSPASFKKTTELGNRWQGDPKNLALGLAYAAELEKLGQTDQQLQVLATLSAQNPQNANIQAVYGKKLLAAGRSGDAIPVLKTVADNGTGDWRILSALGSAYDQQGQYSTARETYQKALALKPNQISVLNNMGMSHALEGNLKQAEETLRSAMALPEGKSLPRLRQNLALVVGLQGRFEESRQIASEDLPPEEVEANMAYLQKMLSQPNTWQQLSGDAQG
jgi:Flp pilus assembly protein TadD